MKYIVMSLMIYVSSAMPLYAQLDTDNVMRMGKNAYYYEDYMVAIHYFNMVIDAKPYLYEPYFFRGLCKLQLDDYAGAENDVTKALDRHPFVKDAHEVRGVARQQLGQFAGAIADYDTALMTQPDNRNVMYNRALAQIATGAYDDARHSLDTILSRWPDYEIAYAGRANLYLHTADTIAALADLDSAIVKNIDSGNAYLMRADILVKQGRNEEALPDMDQAMRLLPPNAGLYINRAVLRYQTWDYRGAMADLNAALEMQPDNLTAIYNRAMLRMEIHDYNNAIVDLTGVLKQRPHHYRALFNRANLYRETGDLRRALNDINAVIKAFPTFATATYLRGELNYRLGNHSAAERDYRRAVELARRRVTVLPDSDIGGGEENQDGNVDATADIFSESQEQVQKRFTSMLRDDEGAMESVVKWQGVQGKTRGNVQDTNFAIETEPLYTLSFYTDDSELHNTLDLSREINDINNSRLLRGPLFCSARPPVIIDEETISWHENSIDYYTSYLATHSPRAIDYFGRGMDFMTVRNYTAAVEDFGRATEISADFSLAYLMRGVARWMELNADSRASSRGHDEAASMLRQSGIKAVIADFEQAARLSPDMAVVSYNLGTVLLSLGDYTGALTSFDKALSLNPSMGEAFYNRGYAAMMMGDKESAFSDISRAGELGIAPSYSLLKRMAR